MNLTQILIRLEQGNYFCKDGRVSPKALQNLKKEPDLLESIHNHLSEFDVSTMTFSNILYVLRDYYLLLNVQSVVVHYCLIRHPVPTTLHAHLHVGLAIVRTKHSNCVMLLKIRT